MLPLGFAVVLAGLLGVFFFSKDLLVVAVVALCAVAYVGLGFVVSPSKTTALDQLPADLYPYGASINSTFTQIASAIGPSLFVGVLSSDVLRDTAAGLGESGRVRSRFFACTDTRHRHRSGWVGAGVFVCPFVAGKG